MEESLNSEGRQKQLEEQLAFQQHQLDQLNTALLMQRAELDSFRQDLVGLVNEVRKLIENSGTDLPHEKPPHY